MALRTRSAWDDALYLLAPLATLVLLIRVQHVFAIDFEQQYWVVGHRLLVGGSPYAWTHAQIASGAGAFPYPALAAVLFVPFGLLPTGVAAWIWVGILMSAVVATLRIVSVRDRRLYALAFLWWPVIGGWETGNLTLLLALLLALVWRHRNEPFLAGLLVAVMVSLKPYMWPIGLWLLATRRYRATIWALACGLALNLFAWGLVGFDQVGRYLHLDAAVVSALYRDGYGIIAMMARLGASRGVGMACLVVVAIMLGALCVWLAYKRREAEALLVATLLTLAGSPLAWNHYLALLIVPLAILRPRLSPEWLLPLLIWLCPGGLQESGWQVALFALITASFVGLLLRGRAVGSGSQAASDNRRPGQAHVLATAQGGERAG